MADEQNKPGERPASSRRAFLGGALGAASLVAAGGAGFGIARASEPDDNSGTGGRDTAAGAGASTATVPFYGEHQAGIATPAQSRLAFAAFDVTTQDPQRLQTMLAQWAAAAAQMTQGRPIGPVETAPTAPPIDTGEALGLPASNLTVTVGFGPSLFDDRFGLARFKPALLENLPPLPGDMIQAERSHGDIGVQACADDPQVAFHVIRNFARLARGTAVMRWSELGFGRTSSTSSHQQTPRNLMGFKDGTRNIKSEDTADFDDYVWVGDETDQPWLKGGSYLIARRIRMLIESWDTDYLADQEKVFGRFKDSGAPLTGAHEFDTPNLSAKKDGKYVIDLNAHIRLASPVSNGGKKILRRGYSYTDGIDPQTGLLDAGLFFIAYQKNPEEQFIRIQRQLGARDNLNEYIHHTSSAIFAVPPGLSGAGDYYGRPLFS